MKLDEVLKAAGKNKRKRRIGRGTGSGRGKTSGRGHKGYGSRAGAKRRLGYEGGQNPQVARLPKRGFSNVMFAKEFQVVNLATLQERFEDGARVDAEALHRARLIEDAAKPVKILGNGEIGKKLTVVASRFSKTAAEKIAAAGGTVEQLDPAPQPEPKVKKKPEADAKDRKSPKAEKPPKAKAAGEPKGEKAPKAEKADKSEQEPQGKKQPEEKQQEQQEPQAESAGEEPKKEDRGAEE